MYKDLFSESAATRVSIRLVSRQFMLVLSALKTVPIKNVFGFPIWIFTITHVGQISQ